VFAVEVLERTQQERALVFELVARHGPGGTGAPVLPGW
jgi:hypothetical protein